MRRLILIVLYVMLAVPVSGQVEFQVVSASPLAREVVEVQQHLGELAEFLLEANWEHCHSVRWQKLSDKPAAQVCVFDDLYFNRQFLYVRIASWGALEATVVVLRDGEVVDVLNRHDYEGTSELTLVLGPGSYEIFVWASWLSQDVSYTHSVGFTIDPASSVQS